MGAPPESGAGEFAERTREASPYTTLRHPPQPEPVADPWVTIGEAARRARLVQHLYDLGPRPVLEFVDELARAHEIGGSVDELLEVYEDLDPLIVAALGAREIPQPPIHEFWKST